MASSDKTTIERQSDSGMDSAKQFFETMKAFRDEVLEAGVDYGMIPGGRSGILTKSGAEKIIRSFGSAAIVELTHDHVDYQTGFRHVSAKCSILKGDRLIGIGFGDANSNELTFGGETGKNKYSTWNPVLKRAKKRAISDAVMTTFACSGLFGSDHDDLTDGEQESRMLGGKTDQNRKEPAKVSSGKVSQKQIRLIMYLAGKLKGTPEFEPYKDITEAGLANLPQSEASALIDELQRVTKG